MENTQNPQPGPAQPEPTLVPMETMERARKPRQVILRDPESGEEQIAAVDAMLVEALAAGPQKLGPPLLAAMLSGQYFIALTWRQAPQPPDDLGHFWHREGLNATDVIPALKHCARSFAAKEINQLARQSTDAGGWS